MGSTLVWFRRDLRVDDNPALLEAARRGTGVVPVFIWAPDEEGDWTAGAASRWWLHTSLEALDHDLRRLGSRLILRRGPAAPVLGDLVRDTGATAVYWNRGYEPAALDRDRRITTWLVQKGTAVESFNGSLLFQPWDVKTRQGQPYRVFTPFWRACLNAPPPAAPQGAPDRLARPRRWPTSVDLHTLGLEVDAAWTTGLAAAWTRGSRGALEQLSAFIKNRVLAYAEGRNRPDRPATARLSPHLHLGEVSPRFVWHAVDTAAQSAATAGARESIRSFKSQLGWREFAHHLLFHFPQTTDHPLRPEFAGFPWRTDASQLSAWQRGQAGYPIVDAGMRELWATGWMHNRVRMVVASFLVKDLLLPWQDGARWFWETLVDADLANNSLGWQWTTGCGADAAPFFRIFNPASQGQRFTLLYRPGRSRPSHYGHRLDRP